MQLAVAQHTDHRGDEILTLVRQAFIAKGFDGASMQDLARAVGMSVGNFYRYFPSKSAIITGLIDKDLADIQRDFQAILGSDQPMITLRQVVQMKLAEHGQNGDAALWSEIEAAARRSPEIGAAAQAMEAGVSACLLSVFAAETGLTLAEATDRFATSAGFILVLFKAATCLNCGGHVDQSELRAMIIRTIDQTLDDVANSVRKA